MDTLIAFMLNPEDFIENYVIDWPSFIGGAAWGALLLAVVFALT